MTRGDPPDALSAETALLPSEKGAVLDGRFKVGAFIARGGMGEVFEGLDLSLGRAVAIKFLSERFRGDAEVVRRFRREAEALATLEHASVVPVYAVGEHEGRPYLVMKRLHGRTLDVVIRELGRLPLGAVVFVGAQVCEGLSRIHEKRYVHRDIKPSNLMIDAEGGCVLLDFGIFRAEDSDLTSTGVIVGTPEYMAPEQARAAKLAEARSDLYALGATLYAALVGAPPFLGDSGYEIIHKHHTEKVPPPSQRVSGLSRAVDAFFTRALAKEPAQRFADARAMGAALRALAAPSWPAPAARRAGAGTRDEGARALLAPSTHARGELEAGAPAQRKRTRWRPLTLVLGASALAAVLLLIFVRDDAGTPDVAPPAGSVDATRGSPAAATAAPAITAAPSAPTPQPARTATATTPSPADTETADAPRPTRRRAIRAARPQAPEPQAPEEETAAPATAPTPAHKPAAVAPLADGYLRVVTVHQGQAAWADITLDGARAGKSPIAVWKRVSAGLHVIIANRVGYEPATERVRIAPGERRKVTLELTKVEP